MKTICKSLLALLFVGTLSFTAQANDIAPEKTLSAEIASMMTGIVLPAGDDFEAKVKFLINKDNQIVVVSVDTQDEFMESLIKSRLNYRTVTSDEATPNKINTVKIKVKQP